MAIGITEILILIIIVVVIWFLFFKGNKQQQQQQQQVVIQGDWAGKKRVCPKCGLQNHGDAKFCSDCGFKFTQQ